MSCLKQFNLKVVLRLLGSLFQVLSPTYDKLCIPNFDLRKGNFNFLLQERVATPLSPTGQKTKFKYSGQWEIAYNQTKREHPVSLWRNENVLYKLVNKY